MKLLQKAEVDLKYKKQNDELIGKNNRLLGYFTKGVARLNSLKDNYDQVKVNKYNDFVDFSNHIAQQKSKLMEEVVVIEKLIKEKTETYYGLIAKQDELDEREFNMKQKANNLSMREEFVKESEEKIKLKWDKLIN